MTAPAIYSYYQNKDGLYLTALTEGFQMQASPPSLKERSLDPIAEAFLGETRKRY